MGENVNDWASMKHKFKMSDKNDWLLDGGG